MNASEEAGGETPFVLRRDDGGVVTLTLNRGQRFNPLSMAMVAALEAEIDALRADRTARVVVLAGAGKGSAPATTSRRCAPTAPTSRGSRSSSPIAAG